VEPKFLLSLFKRPKVAYDFFKAQVLLQKVEGEIRSELESLGSKNKKLSFPHLALSAKDYWQRNFFSILFVSIYQAMDLDQKRLWHYTKILHSIRGVVTATDNILDSEDKGALKVHLPGGQVLSNIISVLMQTGVIFDSLDKISENPNQKHRAWGAIFDSLYAIGEEESTEEKNIEDALTPVGILNEIHNHRGGGLLLLAFAAPEVVETEKSEKMKLATDGVYRIGMGLQILDDVCDFKEDITRRNHNILRSIIIHGNSDSVKTTDSDLSKLSEKELDEVHKLFPMSTCEAMCLALDYTMSGFSKLTEMGHSLDPDSALILVEAMFKLRGLGNLWDFYMVTKDQVDHGIEFDSGVAKSL
jgi:hypothetical protein